MVGRPTPCSPLDLTPAHHFLVSAPSSPPRHTQIRATTLLPCLGPFIIIVHPLAKYTVTMGRQNLAWIRRPKGARPRSQRLLFLSPPPPLYRELPVSLSHTHFRAVHPKPAANRHIRIHRVGGVSKKRKKPTATVCSMAAQLSIDSESFRSSATRVVRKPLWLKSATITRLSAGHAPPRLDTSRRRYQPMTQNSLTSMLPKRASRQAQDTLFVFYFHRPFLASDPEPPPPPPPPPHLFHVSAVTACPIKLKRYFLLSFLKMRDPERGKRDL
ncbi:hypothetical protein F5148DRAFT_694314 [Russula earlei]|uniref:Uncharacterized protein n=1 Tax=Russula earlei TaxID=71964 RepID=A0ACC0UE16_9AGAM|nr:hypothetical protein F5148DRAFT_694314 [Russula earlei]